MAHFSWKQRSLVLSLMLMVVSFDALAIAREPIPIKRDHRVRTLTYQADDVFSFTGHYGFQSAIEFEADEEIVTISMGDSTGWQINPIGNRLFLKPIDQDATTNMTLLTTKRTYLFELHAREAFAIDDESMLFILRFIYPGQASTSLLANFNDDVPIGRALENPDDFNFAYTISGPELLSPVRIFDDGEFTYFEFRNLNADIPAFFLVDPNNEESLVNYRVRGNYIIVERVTEKYTLRYGKQIVCAFNEDIRKSRQLSSRNHLGGRE